jgi:hypothetical protein
MTNPLVATTVLFSTIARTPPAPLPARVRSRRRWTPWRSR